MSSQKLIPETITSSDLFPTRFESQVEKFKDKIAIKEQENYLTYGELNRETNQIAHQTLSFHPEHNIPIVILTSYGSPTIKSMIGVLKAGKPYVVVDPTYPEHRIRTILEDSLSNLIITDDENLELTELVLESTSNLSSVEILNINRINQATSTANPGITISPDDFAFLIYTSGTTGKPKGVINNHRNLLSKITKYTSSNKVTEGDNILLIASLSFSASTTDVFGPLANGATIFPFQIKNHGFTQLAKWMMEEKITMYHSVPTTFRHFAKSLTENDQFPHLRSIRLGGEAIYKIDVDLYKKHFPDKCILRISLAGTESSGICHNIIDKNTEVKSEIVPVGRPSKETDVFLLDEDLNPVKPGEIGEIAIKSAYMPVGYWRQPDLTEKKYLPDPEGTDKRICLTGDMGRFLPDGTLEHIARKDTMVKIRGLRIEITEIEAHLLALDTIREAAVEPQKDRFNEQRLVAYIVPNGDTKPTILELRESIAQKLPEYMVPSTFIYLDSLQLTASGKINRRELLKPPEGRSIYGQDYIAPKSDIEKTLVRIFEKHLDIQPIGIRDNFFELGGHSLSAIQIVTEIEEKLNHSFPIPEFINALTVEKIASIIQSRDRVDSFNYLVDLKTNGSLPPLFCVPPSASTAIRFEKMVNHIGVDQPVYGFEYAGMDGKSEPFSTVKMMAQSFIKEMRVVQPKGPYYLAGLCFGGIVAFEMAQQLVSQGQKVAFLGVMDSNFFPRKRKHFLYYYILVKQFIANLRDKELDIIVPSLDYRVKKFAEDDPLKQRFRHAYTVHYIARLRYSTEPYPELITKFTTDSYRARFSTRGWAKVAGGGLEDHLIPGGHSGLGRGQTSFMAEPYIQAFVEQLTECLEKARRNINSDQNSK